MMREPFDPPGPGDPPSARRLVFARFVETDAEALAAILLDPEVARNITASAKDPQSSLACARQRIAWHNASWASHGYGVWAIRLQADPERLIGWCGFAPPDGDGVEPEILYGLDRRDWGRGLGLEAAAAAIDWLFERTALAGCSAMIFARLNPGSLKIAEKLGMRRRGAMAYRDFLPDAALAAAVLDYEIWRLREGATADPEALLFQAPYKAGQLVSTGVAEAEGVAAALDEAAAARAVLSGLAAEPARRQAAESFREGLASAEVDWYRLARADWPARGG